VGVQVVQDQHQPLRLRVVHLHQFFNTLGPVSLGPPSSDHNLPPTARGS
jgi:hypothetical protein